MSTGTLAPARDTTIDRALLHWARRFEAIHTIVGAGLLVGGLVGGVLDFPTGWRALTALGAFMLAIGVAARLDPERPPVATAVRQDPPASAPPRAVRWDGWQGSRSP